MSLEDEILAEARARRERLDHPPGGHTSSELDIVAVPMARALVIARIEAEAEDRRRTAERREAERAIAADLRRWGHYIHIVGQSFNSPNKKSVIKAVQRAVCKYYGISQMDLVSTRRTAQVVRGRQVAMYLAKVLTAKSFPELGRQFGSKDHTTVLHAVNKIGGLLPTDAQLAADVAAIRRQLEGA